MAEARRLQIRFTGRVQGVGFRATCRHLALQHDLSGWARNEPDGTVLAELQGDADAISTFLHQLGQTRAGAGIRDQSPVRMSPVPNDSRFVIR